MHNNILFLPDLVLLDLGLKLQHPDCSPEENQIHPLYFRFGIYMYRSVRIQNLLSSPYPARSNKIPDLQFLHYILRSDFSNIFRMAPR